MQHCQSRNWEDTETHPRNASSTSPSSSFGAVKSLFLLDEIALIFGQDNRFVRRIVKISILKQLGTEFKALTWLMVTVTHVHTHIRTTYRVSLWQEITTTCLFFFLGRDRWCCSTLSGLSGKRIGEWRKNGGSCGGMEGSAWRVARW